MSEKDKKKKDELKLADTNAVFETGIINQKPTENATDIEDYTISPLVITVCNSKISSKDRDDVTLGVKTNKSDEDSENSDENEDIVLQLHPIYGEEESYIKNFTILEMIKRLENGESVSDIHKDMISFIKNTYNENPDKAIYAISQLLMDAEHFYDNSIYTKGLLNPNKIFREEGYHREHLGDNSLEILEKVLATPKGCELDGFVCSTIHEFGMRLLDECGVPAVMLAGSAGTSNHTTLLWQTSDGRYVLTNYGDSHALNATNMKDAALEVYKRGMGLINNGYMYFIDNNGSYQEFAAKEEAVWGKELDKRFYNSQTFFDRTIADKSSIGGKAFVSNMGQISAEVKGVLAYHNDSTAKETSYSVGYKLNKNTSLADKSQSIGVQINHKSETLLDNGKKFSETKAIIDLTKFHTDEKTINNNYIQPITDLDITNKDDLEKLREILGKQYEADNPIEDFFSTIEKMESSIICREKMIEDLINSIESHRETIKGLEELLKNNTWTNESPMSYEEYCTAQGYSSGTQNILQNRNALMGYQEYLIQGNYKEALNYIYEQIREFESLIKSHTSDISSYNENIIKYKNKIMNCKNAIDNYETDKNAFVDQYMPKLRDDLLGFKDTATLREFDVTHLTAFVRRVFGREWTPLKDKGVELTHGYQLSGLLGANDVLTYTSFGKTQSAALSVGGDIRLGAEYGGKVDISSGNTLFSNTLNGGLTADMSLKSGTLTPAVKPGLKLNGSSLFKTRISDNAQVGAGISGYAVFAGFPQNTTSTDYGYNAQLSGVCKLNNSDVTIFGAANTGMDKQRLNIGGFSQETEKIQTFGVTIGVQNRKGSVSLNYNNEINKLNATKNRKIFSIGAALNI